MIATIVDQTGEVVSVITAVDQEHIDLNTPAGCTAIDGAAPLDSYFDLTAKAWVQKPTRPATYSTWDTQTKAWIDGRTLAQVQAAQIAVLAAAYTAAIAQPVTYTSQAGVTQTYQCDPASIANVERMQLAFAGAGATPAGFYWVALDNAQVPFTYADVQGLAAAMGAQGFTAFAHLQTQKAAVLAATAAAAVQAVAW